MKKIAVIYYSRGGATGKMAELVAEGARSESGVDVDVCNVVGLSEDKLLAYDGVILGSPTYYASMAGEMKDFLDRTVKFHGQLDGKVGAAFTSAANIGGGNETTIRGILDALLVHGMVVQGNPRGDHFGPVSIGNPDDRVREQCRELGRRVAILTKQLG